MRSFIRFLAIAALAACGGDDIQFIDAADPIDAPGTDAATDAVAADAVLDAPPDGPTIDAPVIDAPPIDAPVIDAPPTDAAQIDAAPIDAAQIDAAPPIDAALIDAAQIDAAPPIDAGTQIDAAAPQAGDSCQLAEVVTIAGGLGSASVTGSTLLYSNDYEPTCTTYSTIGNDRVYSVMVPGGARLIAGVTPASGYDAGIYFIGAPAASCDAAAITCLAADDTGGSGAYDSASFVNGGTGAVEVFMVVDGFLTGGGAFTLDVSVDVAGPGDTCSNAGVITIPVGMTSTTVTGTTVGMANDYDPGVSCTDWYTDGADRVHTISVPSGATLDVAMTPAATYDAGVYLIAGPAAACYAMPIECLDGLDFGGDGDVENVSYTNETGSAHEVLIGVDGSRTPAINTGTYSLAVTITLP